MQAYVQTQPMEETHVPRSAAVERRIVAPEAKKGLRVFWILLILIAALVGVNTRVPARLQFPADRRI